MNNNDDARRAEVSGWSARAAADWLASQGVDAAIVASARAHDVDGSELTLWHDDPAECDAAVDEWEGVVASAAHAELHRVLSTLLPSARVSSSENSAAAANTDTHSAARGAMGGVTDGGHTSGNLAQKDAPEVMEAFSLMCAEAEHLVRVREKYIDEKLAEAEAESDAMMRAAAAAAETAYDGPEGGEDARPDRIAEDCAVVLPPVQCVVVQAKQTSV